MHVASSSRVRVEQVPVPGSQVLALWHSSAAAHITGLLPVQAPPWHVCVCMHLSTPSHVVPSIAAGVVHCPVFRLHAPATWHWSRGVHDSDFAGFVQEPVVGSHTPAVWHRSRAAHTTGLAPVQTPPWHVSVCVHLSLSSHSVPFTADGFVHWPVARSHVPATWHWSAAVQVNGFNGFVHAPVVGSHSPTT